MNFSRVLKLSSYQDTRSPKPIVVSLTLETVSRFVIQLLPCVFVFFFCTFAQRGHEENFSMSREKKYSISIYLV